MTHQHKDHPHKHKQHKQATDVENTVKDGSTKQQKSATDNKNAPTMPPTNDAGDAVSEASLYDASGKATGGGVDISDAVVQSTNEAVKKHHHIHQEGE